ncbi:MAG: hypothetical protein JSV09_08480 [Thermoplasmata archaeon]|nr:MAG: hypothetical protein JSV09_08480 [Thermoplasmata archaeon]
MIRLGKLAPAGIVAGNLALFLASSSWFLAGNPPLTHHWLLPFHEALLLGQARLLRKVWAGTGLTITSLIILFVGLIRIESIYTAHHLIHFSITLALAAFLHEILRRRLTGAWKRLNGVLASACFLLAAVSTMAVVRREIWWDLG